MSAMARQNRTGSWEGPADDASTWRRKRPQSGRPAMNPDADRFWRAPRRALAVLLVLLACSGRSPSTPTFRCSRALRAPGATPVEMQQTLSVYLFGF